MDMAIVLDCAALKLVGTGDVPASQVHLLANEVMSAAAKYGVSMNIVRSSGVIGEG